MAKAKKGDTVRVHYTGKLDDGTVFDSSAGKDTLEFTIGKGQLIAGFEKAVEGLKTGESVTVNISPEQGYGVHRPEMVTEMDRSQLPEKLDVKVGQRLQMRAKEGQSKEGQSKEGKSLVVEVTALSGTKLTVDANHKLAGRDLTFDIELVEIA
jgi:peptidylprolyl isomerase